MHVVYFNFQNKYSLERGDLGLLETAKPPKNLTTTAKPNLKIYEKQQAAMISNQNCQKYAVTTGKHDKKLMETGKSKILMSPSGGGHWGLRYCAVGQFFLQYFGNFNLELWYCSILQTCGMQFFGIFDGIKKLSFKSSNVFGAFSSF